MAPSTVASWLSKLLGIACRSNCSHPKRNLGFSILVPVLLGLGSILLEIQDDPSVLLTSSDNPALRWQRDFGQAFGDLRPVNFLYEPLDTSESVLEKEHLLQYYDVQKNFLGINITVDGRSINREDICYRLLTPQKQMGCVVTSITDYWPDRKSLEADETPLRTISRLVPSYCGKPLVPASLIGGLQHEPHVPSLVRSGTSLRFTLLLHVNVSDEAIVAGAKKYELRFREEANRINAEGMSRSHKPFRVSYQVQSGIEAEIRSDYSEAVILFVVSFLAMFSCTAFVQRGYGTSSVTRSRIGVGLAGMFFVFLSILAGTGLCGLLGVSLNPLGIQVLPFFIFGIGMDNIFVLTQAYRLANGSTVASRLEQAYRTAGYAVVSATLQSILAFLCIVVIDMNLVKSLAIHASIIMVVNTILQVVGLGAVIVLDDRRYEGSNHGSTSESMETITVSEISPSRLEKILARFHDNVLQKRPCRRVIMVLFALMVAASGANVRNLRLGLDITDVIKAESPIRHFIMENIQQYPNEMLYFVVLNTTSVTNMRSVQEDFKSIATKISTTPASSESVGTVFWYTNWLSWLEKVSDHGKELERTSDGSLWVPEEKFTVWLKEFLADTKYGGICHSGDVIWDDFGEKVVASRMLGSYMPLNVTMDYYWGYSMTKEALEETRIPAYPHAFFYVMVSNFGSIVSGLISAVALAMVACCLLNYLFLQDALLTALTFGTLVGMLTCLFCFIPVLGLKVNPILATNAVVMMGIGIDNLTCVSRAYQLRSTEDEEIEATFVISSDSDGEDMPEKETKRMDREHNSGLKRSEWYHSTGTSLLVSALCSLVTTIMMVPARSPLVSEIFFRTYFTLIVTVCLYALVFFPAFWIELRAYRGGRKLQCAY